MYLFRIITIFLIVILVYTLIDINYHYSSIVNNNVEKLMHDTNFKSTKQSTYITQELSICNPVTLQDFGKFERNRIVLF